MTNYICPVCGKEATKKSDILYMVVTSNPTVPYVNEVFEYICNDCGTIWFGVD